MMKWVAVLAGLVLSVFAGAQSRFGGIVELDRTVCDFGDISATQGPVSCQYKVKNISGGTIYLLNAVSSCGCTDVKWTREGIKPGETGIVSATYKNDDGAYPFDKTVTLYVQNLKQPVVLHLRGIVHEKQLPLAQLYPVHFGSFGIRSCEVKCGNLTQGQQKSGEIKVANVGKTPIRVSFRDVSPFLKLRVEPETIPAESTATLIYTVDSDRKLWGNNWYYATPLVDGRSYPALLVREGSDVKPARGTEAIFSEPNPVLGAGKEQMGFRAFTKEDFSGMSKEEKAAAGNPVFESSSFSFGQVKAGTRVEAVFVASNSGKSTLHVFKADTDSRRLSVQTFSELKPGSKGVVRAVLDTSGMPSGEHTLILTLTTDSPLRPMVNLYVNGFIK